MDPQYQPILDQFSETVEGFPYPRWKEVSDWCQENVPSTNHTLFWQSVTQAWIGRIRQKLGDAYRIHETELFLLLSSGDDERARKIIEYAESSLVKILRSLGDLANLEDEGQFRMILIDDPDLYWNYISQFKTCNQSSVSVLIDEGLPHIAIHSSASGFPRGLLFRELARQCMMHLSLPRWLEEGLFYLITTSGGFSGSVQMNEEIVNRHCEYWDEEKIQQFWSGNAFCQFDDSRELSLELAPILLHLLFSDIRPSRHDFDNFVRNASIKDAGEASALEHLQLSLGDLAGIFLGEGDWAPHLTQPESLSEEKPE